MQTFKTLSTIKLYKKICILFYKNLKFCILFFITNIIDVNMSPIIIRFLVNTNIFYIKIKFFISEIVTTCN